MSSSTLLQGPALVLRPVMDAFTALPTYLQVLVLLIGVPALAIALNVASQLVRPLPLALYISYQLHITTTRFPLFTGFHSTCESDGRACDCVW